MLAIAAGYFCVRLWRGKDVEAFANMDDIALSLTGATASTVRAMLFLRHEFGVIGIVCQPWRYPAIGHVPSDGEIYINSWKVYTPE